MRLAGRDHDIYAWDGGLPTTDEIHRAPAFTVFPAPREVDGPLPFGDDIEVEGVDERLWFPTERDQQTYSDDVLEVLDKAGLGAADQLNIININDDLRGLTVRFKGRRIDVKADDQAWPWAIEAGYTLVKVPDAFGSPYYVLYIVDKFQSYGDNYYWEQTPLRAQLVSPATLSPAVAAALDAINRHRASMGMPRLDPVGSAWTEKDVLLEAERIARLPNPLLDLKRRLLQSRRHNQGYTLEEYPVLPVTKWNQTYVFPFTKKDDDLLRQIARDERWKLRSVEGIGSEKFSRPAYHLSSSDRHSDPLNSLVEVYDWRGWWAEPAIDEEGIQFWNFIDPDQIDKELEEDWGRLLVGPYANPERWLAPKLRTPHRARLKQLHDVYFDLFEEIESLPDARLTTETGEYTVPEGYALLYRVGDVDYVFFQDEAPAETWSFVTVGRAGEADRVDHLEDYLAVLERVNEAAIRQVRGQNPANRVPRRRRA